MTTYILVWTEDIVVTMVVSVIIKGRQQVFISCHQDRQQVFTSCHQGSSPLLSRSSPRFTSHHKSRHLVVRQERKNFQKVVTCHHLLSVHLDKNFQVAKFPVLQSILYKQERQLSTLTINIARWSRQMSSRNFQGRQQVVTLIVKGSHPLLSGSSGSYFGHHFGRHVSWEVVTSVITQDSPHPQLGSLVILVVTL